MDTIVRPPRMDSVSIATERNRRRWPWIVSGVLLVLIVIGSATGAVWVANYDPLAPGFHLYGALDDRIRVSDVDILDASGRVLEMPVSGPTTFRYRFSIQNEGPVTVRIDRVGPPGQTGQVRRRPVGVIQDISRTQNALERWHPFLLSPGEHAAIEMEVSYVPRTCLPRGGSFGMWPETISFTVLGFRRETVFETDVDVRVVGTRDCPES